MGVGGGNEIKETRLVQQGTLISFILFFMGNLCTVVVVRLRAVLSFF